MTLSELRDAINELEDMEGDHVLDMDVYAEYDYGDHSHTRALTVFSDIQIVNPRRTAYSDSGLAISDEEDRADNQKPVIALTRR